MFGISLVFLRKPTRLAVSALLFGSVLGGGVSSACAQGSNPAPDFSGTYEIQDVASGLALQVAGALSTNGAPILQEHFNGATSALWTLVPTSGGYYRIRNVNSGLDVNASGVPGQKEAKIVQGQFGAEGKNQWLPMANGDGTYSFANRGSGLLLDDPAASMAAGTQFVQSEGNGQTSQSFNLVLVPSTVQPVKVVGGYYPWWVGSPLRLRSIDAHYNLIYLFAATPQAGDTSGAVIWQPPSDVNGAWTNWNADLQYARTVQHRRIILSVGGANENVPLPNRAASTAFVNSIDALYNAWGGFDGIDWDTYEGTDAPNTPEMIWASQELKRRHPGFLITSPPAPWSGVDRQFCSDMLKAGALDWCAPQYYDGPNLADPNWILPNVDVWMNLLGPAHVVIGFGVDPQAANYETISVAESVWSQIKAKYPTVEGAFDWQINNDSLQGYPFATQLGPLIP